MSTTQTTEYQKTYKDQKRIVVYVRPDVKQTLAQHAIDTGVSLSQLISPKLEKLSNGIKRRSI